MAEYVPVIWMDHASGTVEGTQINKERLDQMQTQYKLTAGSRSLNVEPNDPKEGDWYYDNSRNEFRIYSGGWKTILWTGSTLIQNKPLKWDGSGIVSGNVTMDDVTDLGSTLADKADLSLLNGKADISALDGKADISMLDGKVDKIEGKGLSSKDYTETEKTKLAGIADNADKTVIENTWQSLQTNNTVPSTKLVKDSLDAKADSAQLSSKANLTNGAMSDPIHFEEFNGTLTQFMDSVPVGSTKESVLSNTMAERPFPEWPGEYGVLTKVSRYNDVIYFIECRLGADIVLHASRFIIRCQPDNGWIRPKAWRTTYDAVDIRNNGGILFNQEYSSEEYCKGILSDGTVLRVTINDPRVNRTETVILNFMTGGEAGSIFLPEAQSVGNQIFIGWTIFERRDGGRKFYPFLYSSNVINGGNWYADAYARIVKIERETYI